MLAAMVLPIASYAQTWQPLTNTPNFNAGAPLLLTDGTVMVYHLDSSLYGSGLWSKLTPDENGSYVNGTWSTIASMPKGYAPLYFASAVLPDGRVICEGGEYNEHSGGEVNLGAIYDPVANTWTTVAPPAGMEQYRRRVECGVADWDIHVGGFADEPGGFSESELVDLDSGSDGRQGRRKQRRRLDVASGRIDIDRRHE